MGKELEHLKNYYQENYYNEEVENRIKNGVYQQLNSENKNTLGKKLIYISCTAVVLLGLFISSAFVSPAMADVVSKIPFLNHLFEPQKPWLVAVSQELKKEYKIDGIGINFTTKTMHIGIKGTEAYYQDVKKEVEKKAKDLMQARGLDAYKIAVSYDDGKPIHDEKLSKEQMAKNKKYIAASQDLENAIMSELKNKNYGIVSAHVRINSKEKFIPLEILVSEKRVDEIKQIVKNIVKEKNLGKFKIKFYHLNPKAEEADKRWQPVISTITDGLMGKKEFRVTGVGYSFYPLPLTLSIRTSVDSADPDAKKLAAKIEKTVKDFIESDEVQPVVKNDPYNIEIYSKDKKKLN